MRIVALVVTLHIVLIAYLVWNPWSKLPVNQPKKLLVQTVSLSSPLTEIAPPPTYTEVAQSTIAFPEPEPESEPEPKPKATPKPVAKKVDAPVKKKPAPALAKTKKTATKKAPTPLVRSAKEIALLDSLEESIEKIGKKADKTRKALNIEVPKEITSLRIDSAHASSGASDFEKTYQDDLASLLKSYLMLPEYGDVTVSLVIKRNGKLSSVSIVKAKSEKNKRYLEKSLKELSFPSFGPYFKGEETHAFTLTLSNQS